DLVICIRLNKNLLSYMYLCYSLRNNNINLFTYLLTTDLEKSDYRNEASDIIKFSMIVDSCCDATQALIKELNLIKIPLNLMLGDREIVDNEQLDLTQFMADMKACTGKVGSSAPAPALYQEAFDQAENSFAVTLSSRLSSSYSSAMLGKEMMESTSNDVYVFDSKSASAGQLLIVLKIYELAQLGLAKSDIISRTEDFIKHMKTYFVLDNIDNLMKNGRLSKVKGKLINMLNI